MLRIYLKNGNRVSILITEPERNVFGSYETKTHLLTKAGKIEKEFIDRWEIIKDKWENGKGTGENTQGLV